MASVYSSVSHPFLLSPASSAPLLRTLRLNPVLFNLTGDRYEGNGASKTNSGFFEQAILAQGERISSSGDGPIDEFWDGESGNPTEGRPEVKVVANGVSRLVSPKHEPY
jgi:hypothetical protein